MGFFGLIFVILSSSLLLKTSLITAQTYSYHICLGGNHTRNSTFQENLSILLASISSGTTPNNAKFYTNSVGSEPDRVYGLFQCRGDYENEECKRFVSVSTEEIKTQCPFNKEAIIFYDEFWLHYSNESFIARVQYEPTLRYRYRENTSYPSQFSLMFPKLMNSLVVKAVSSPNLFAVGQVNLTISQRIYGLVQCIQGLNRSDCDTCLSQAFSNFSECCDTKIGGGVLKPSCIALYQDIQFFRYPQASASPPPLLATTPGNTTTTSAQEKRPSHLVVFIVVPTVIVLLLIFTIIIFFRLSRKKKLDIIKEDVNVISNVHSLQLNFATVVAATSNFCVTNKLGEGGFGSVYKGKLLDGRDIAVKRLSQNSVQGLEEFKNEVELLVKLQHRNLVKLLGFCVEGDEKVLIYEFVSNGSLDSYIFDPIKVTVLDWEKRYRIIRGIARGLLYLHVDSRDNIIHRDLKASNVLLDEQMNPKISDFGMARLFTIDQTLGKTKRIVGTYGYMAPEYAIRGHFSVKSDVFSFGVLVLEIITGKKNSRYYESQGDKYLLSYAWKYLLEGIALELLEPQLRENCCEIQVLRCIQIGLLCVQGDAEKRPTMASISVMLNSNSVTIPSPSAPGFFVNTGTEFNMIPEESEISTTGSSLSTLQDQSTSSSRTRSINEVSISELHPR